MHFNWSFENDFCISGYFHDEEDMSVANDADVTFSLEQNPNTQFELKLKTGMTQNSKVLCSFGTDSDTALMRFHNLYVALLSGKSALDAVEYAKSVVLNV